MDAKNRLIKTVALAEEVNDFDFEATNTGWTGGAYGAGARMPIKATRALLTATLDGSLSEVEFRMDPNFGFEVPKDAPGAPTVLLDPRRTWDKPDSYDRQAAKLIEQNFDQYFRISTTTWRPPRSVDAPPRTGSAPSAPFPPIT